METIPVIPDPVSLLASMRAVGYSVEAAIADLVDNSISASAARIDIKYDASDFPFIAILDNGRGMGPAELTNAMRLGSQDPGNERHPDDLGRFGLGLKTASLSQCRCFTVVSKKSGMISARCWDLDTIERLHEWRVVVPDSEQLASLPLMTKLEQCESGTLVVWQDLDRLVAGARNPQQEMTTKLSPLFEHLALVFHRYSAGEGGNTAIEIYVNSRKVPARDPYLRGNSFRQPLEGQVIRHERGDVLVTPVILPPVSHLNADEIEVAGGRDGLRGTQGFYVYRNRRLVIWGTWFRLVPKDEFYKLTRVQVDIPNSFDDLWALDIKKSAAYPPDAIRARLKDLIPHFAGVSRRTITHPGRKTGPKDFTALWQRIEPTHGAFRYEINSEHPAVKALSSRLTPADQGSLQALLGLVGDSLPFESIYADMSSDTHSSNSAGNLAALVEMAEELMTLTGFDVDQVLQIDPLIRYEHLHSKIKAELTIG
ncbi:MAG: ATP-binding protein [Nevskiaceae bacterium]|nr:MAG: ATP-binding protein [Nevskiaceae bacterium]